jgi:membrane protein YdbS with pleckstrin-like domain
VGAMSPNILVLLGFLVLLYGILVGGTWVRRSSEKMWDTVSTIIFIVVAAVATIHLVIVGARQNEAFEKAKNRLDCVAVQIDAIRAQAPIPKCDVRWDATYAP